MNETVLTPPCLSTSPTGTYTGTSYFPYPQVVPIGGYGGSMMPVSPGGYMPGMPGMIGMESYGGAVITTQPYGMTDPRMLSTIGLDYLKLVDHLFIIERPQWIYTMNRIVGSKYYTIKNNFGQEVFYVAEGKF